MTDDEIPAEPEQPSAPDDEAGDTPEEPAEAGGTPADPSGADRTGEFIGREYHATTGSDGVTWKIDGRSGKISGRM